MAAAKAEVKKEEDLSLPEYFMRGAKKGFYITVELIAPAMVMAYTLITFLNLSGIMPLIGKLLAPSWEFLDFRVKLPSSFWRRSSQKLQAVLRLPACI